MVKFGGKNVSNSDRQQIDHVLDLATLGGATKNRNDPVCVAPPIGAKESKESDMVS